MKTLEVLRKAGLPVYYFRFSALDRYFKVNDPPSLHLMVAGNLINLAKLFPGLRYHGIERVDAALPLGEEPPVYFRCVEGAELGDGQHFEVLSLLYDPFRERFLDLLGIYPQLRSRRTAPAPGFDGAWITDAAILLSRYAYGIDTAISPYHEAPLAAESLRDLLLQILTGQKPWEGLKLLMDAGFMEIHWPELAAMRDVSHSKEYHPEGDAWDHTLETFRHRKNTDIVVSLALLLHDAGKPHAQNQEGRRFDKHAEIGTEIAEGFLRRLEFPPSVIRDVLFLVKNHMLPGALKTLPLYRIERVMESELFPQLLEVYRCDLSSTFRGPDGYYEACKIYRSFLKHRKNPFRTSDGKKIQRLREYVAR
jgi:poly(A) polymerase